MSVDLPGTITRYIHDLEAGEPSTRDDAARELCEYFFADMMVCARNRLKALHAPRGPADEEDVAIRAFMKVCRGIERGQLKLASRLDLTRVLRSATTREALTIHCQARAAAHGAGNDTDDLLGRVADPALTPDLLLLAFDACQRLLDLLASDELRQIALWKLVGHTNESIGAKLGRSPATVERTLAQIRETWKHRWSDAVPHEPARPGPRPGARTGRLEPQGRGSGDPGDADLSRILRDLSGLA